MHIDYEISEQDHAHAQRLATKNSAFSRVALVVLPWLGLVILMCVIWFGITQGFSWIFLTGIAVGLFMLSTPFLAMANLHKSYIANPSLRGPLSLDVDDAGLHFRGPTFESQVSWVHFSRFREDQSSFVVFQGPKVFNMIPKRQLSPDQIAALRDCFTRHIKNPA